MLLMGGNDIEDGRAKRRSGKPLRNLVAKNANAFRNGAVIVTAPAFASNDKHKPLSLRLSGQHEADQLGMRLGQRHAMKIDPPLRAQFAAHQ